MSFNLLSRLIQTKLALYKHYASKETIRGDGCQPPQENIIFAFSDSVIGLYCQLRFGEVYMVL